MTFARDAQVIGFQRQLQERLQGVLEVMPVAISWATLDSHRIVFVNRWFTELFGYVAADHTSVVDWIERTYPNQRQAQRAREVWQDMSRQRRSGMIGNPQVEVDVRCKDGSIKTTLFSGAILPELGGGLAMFVDITERKQQERASARLALEDPLTGLPNRRAFMSELRTALARARRRQAIVALLMVDLDGFKPLNDTFGHDVGDRVLLIVAARLKHAIRANDHVCRIGGDEFGIIIDACDTTAVAEQVADRVVAEIRTSFSIEGNEIVIGASIGIAYFPEQAATEETLMKHADGALYRAKHSGRDRWSK
ncbi:MAG: GGDEF domain-containing protein [Gammaproteobacteria bacterium]|nr:GGDEF domain-containing protein [Gammaproteobacteria bacterium]